MSCGGLRYQIRGLRLLLPALLAAILLSGAEPYLGADARQTVIPTVQGYRGTEQATAYTGNFSRHSECDRYLLGRDHVVQQAFHTHPLLLFLLTTCLILDADSYPPGLLRCLPLDATIFLVRIFWQSRQEPSATTLRSPFSPTSGVTISSL